MFRIRTLMATIVAACAVLAPTAMASQTLIADTVDGNGHIIGETTVVNPLAPTPTGMSLNARPVSSAGEHVLAIIPIQFGTADPGFTTAGLNNVVLTGTDSVDKYYRESTYGRMWLTGKVFPLTSITTDTSTCNYNAFANDALSALKSSGQAVTGDGTDGYDHYLFVFANVPACSWAGLASVPGRHIWINGYVERGVIAHELGHNLGLGHANVLHCQDASGVPKVLSATCAESEYADPYEVMGFYGRQLSAVARQLIGVLDAGQQRVVTTSQTLTLESASVVGTGIKSIEIPRPGTEDSWFVEMRSASGYDVFSTSYNVTQGVLIRKRTEDPYWMTDTQLLDATPSTTTATDAAFLPGMSFTDPTGKITISVISRSGNTASVKVTFGTTTTTTTTTTTFTTSLAVARPWTSKITLYRRADGRLYVGVRRATLVGPTCSFRIRAFLLHTGACQSLSTLKGWQVSRVVRAGEYVTINLLVPGYANPVSKKVRAPVKAGRYRIYRLM